MNLPRWVFRALLVTFLPLLAVTRAGAVEPPVRIMPLGDSITMGQAEPGAQGGYRDLLYSMLTLGGYNVDFIGTFEDSNNPELPDKDHQGQPAARVDEINAQIDGWFNMVEVPDVVLIQIGTNNFLQGSNQPSVVLGQLNTLITRIAERHPFAKIIVSTLILSTYSTSVENYQQQYNAGIPGLVAQHAAAGRQVTWVDLHPVLNASDLYDTVHPTTEGYEKMAEAWYPAIQAVISPQGTSNRPVIAWSDALEDSTHVSVTFSKPVASTATTLSNYSISGGLTVTNAVLDTATKRTVTLTTTPQTPGETYTLSVSGVRDRTSAQNEIAPQSKTLFYPNIVSNSSFENLINGYAGWPTHTGNQEIKDSTTSPSYTTWSGYRMAAFNTGGASPNGVLSQSFATIPGKTYYLYFDLGGISWSSSTRRQKIRAQVQGVAPLLDVYSEIIVPNGGVSTWFPWGYEFVADSATAALTFTDVSASSQSHSTDMMLDNVRVSAARFATLAVTSTPGSGPSMTMSPNDVNGNGGGQTGLIRQYNYDSTVTVTAPATHLGGNFVKWQYNGSDIAGSNRVVTVTMTGDISLNAVYQGAIVPVPPVAVDDGSPGSPFLTVVEDSGLSSSMNVLANDSDGNSDPLTITAASSPHGAVTINGGLTLGFTPAANFNGATTISYTISDGNGGSASATVYVSVTAVNDAPVAVDDGSPGSPFATVAEDSGASAAINVRANDSDVDGNPLTITAASSPNGAVTINGGLTLGFTPALNFHGDTTISYTISDGSGGSDSATVYVSVTAVNDAPVAVDDGTVGSPFVTVAEDSGASATINVRANDSDVDGNPLTITAASSPHGAVTINGGLTLSFTPAANFNGATTISYTISDGQGGSASATVYVSVTAVNDAPVAVDDGSVGSPYVTVAEDSGASAAINVRANDSDVDGNPLTITAASSPHGAVTINGGLTLSFTPAANFNGATTISYTISDGQGGSDSATVYVSVTAVNDAPVAVDDGSPGSPYVTVAEDSGETTGITPLVNDSDVDGNPLTITAANSPNGTVTIVGGTALGFTPALNFHGDTTISYTISDGNGGSDTGVVHVRATPVNDAPLAVDDGSVGAPFVTVAEDSGETTGITALSNDSDVDGNPLTITAAGSPHGAVTINGGLTLGFTPALNFHGDTTISYTISDGNGGSDSATVYVSVTAVNDAPVAVDDGSPGSPYVTVAEDSGETTGITPLVNDSDVDGNPLTITAANSPNGTVTIVGGTALGFTPALNFHGDTTISYTISDGNGGSDTAVVHVRATPVNDSPVADDQPVMLDEDTPVFINLTASDVDGDVLNFAVTSPPAHGQLSGSPPALTYSPDPDYSGPDAFIFSVTDPSGAVDTAVVSLIINETGGSPIMEWRTLHNIGPGLSGDSDHDGLSDMVEFVIGGNPAAATEAALRPSAQPVIADPDGDTLSASYFLFSYPRTAAALRDSTLTIMVEWSEDPASGWTEAAGNHGEVTVVSPYPGDSAKDLVETYIPQPPGGRLFARLKVTVADAP